MKRIFWIAAFLATALQLEAFQLPVGSGTQSAAPAETARPMVESYEQTMVTAPPAELGIDPFYSRYADAIGIPIVASGKVPPAAVLMARDIVNYMLAKRPDIRAVMVGKKARICIMAQTEMQTDLPEYRNMKKPAKEDPRLTPRERENYDNPGGIGSMTDREYWNRRARGMGGNITSCAEENLLGYPNTRYYGEHILVHEFSHNIMSTFRTADPQLLKDLQAAYEEAKAQGRFKGQYAINTVAEYWAEGTQWWFWSNFEFFDGETRVQSPDDLKAYDPTLYSLLERVYNGHHIPADIYYGRNIKPARR